MWRCLIPLLLPLLLLGCVDPIEFDQKEQQEHLVVEATFSNLDSSYVRLSYSQPYSLPYNVHVDDASVYITSEEGEQISFIGQGSGLYLPAAGAGAIVGHTYQLHVQVRGKTYASEPELLRQPVPIDTLYFEFAEMEVAIKGKREKALMPGYQVFADFTDPGSKQNFYRWSAAAEFEVLTQPHLYIQYDCRACPRPAPKDCCDQCWVYTREQMYQVLSDRLTNGKKITRQKLQFIPFDRNLHIKYKLRVFQHSISEEAYDFFKVLEQQRQNTGTVFDPPPSQLKGNIYSLDDEEEQVIGYFNASAVSVKEVTVLGTDITEYPIRPYVYPDDCRTIENATTRQPQNW